MSHGAVKLPKDEIFGAIQVGDLDKLKRLLTREHANLKDRSGHTLLHVATQCDKTDICKWLHEDLGADINLHCNGHSVIELALTKANFDLFHFYLDKKADCIGRNQLNLLHEAVNKNRMDIVEVLINKGADPNQLNNMHNTPLTMAVYVKSNQICKCLLDNNACANIADRKGNTPLHIACVTGCFDLVELIVSNTECDLKLKNQNEETALDLLWTTAIKDAKAPIDLLEKLIEHGAQFSMPWNFTFNCHNHIVFVKCMTLLCKYRLKDLFLPDRRVFTDLIIKGYWRNSLIVSIKSAIVDYKTQSQAEQMSLYKSIETIILSGELSLNASDLISTFYMFDEVNDFEVYKLLNVLFSNPFTLMDLCRIAIRKHLLKVDSNYVNSQVKVPDQMKKFLLFDKP
jgi:hypothetical protein